MTSEPTVSAGPDRRDAVGIVMDAIAELIAKRELLPGEPIRQEQIGARLGLSRGPVREALKALSAQQIVSYSRNQGYFVARFNAAEMEQLYRLRGFAEGELLRTVRAPTAEEIASLRQLDAEMKATDQLTELVELNERFHMQIFSLSPLTVTLAEAQRWWRMTAAYRGMALGLAEKATVTADHEQLIAALGRLDREALVAISARHRGASEQALLRLLPTA
ncbi:MAG: GntR family transcriptional regulator [Solirubrobacterales bacterium]